MKRHPPFGSNLFCFEAVDDGLEICNPCCLVTDFKVFSHIQPFPESYTTKYMISSMRMYKPLI